MLPAPKSVRTNLSDTQEKLGGTSYVNRNHCDRAALAIAISTIGPAIGQGLTAAHAMDAIARQPEVAGTIRSNMIIAMGLLESLTIYGLLIAFLLIGKIG